MQALEGKVALVTGASRGIGAAIARQMIGEGASLVGLSKSGASEDDLAASDAYVAMAGDVTAPGVAPRAVGTAVERFGQLDVLVNNAGVDLAKPFRETTAKDARRILEVHVIGAMLMMQAALPELHKRDGAIVNVTSRLATIGVPEMSVYGAAKGGLLSLSRGAAVELAADGIRVNAVAPGMTETDLLHEWLADQPDPDAARRKVAAAIPQGRLAAPENVAAAVVFLSSDRARHITGINLPVDGGYTAT